MNKVIITGATGFIGSWLSKEMADRGYEVYAIVRSNSCNIHKLQKSENIKIIECDLSNIIELSQIIKVRDFDSFFHLAWDGVYGEGSTDYELQVNNIKYSCHAVEAAKELRCSKFIFPSSVMEYECMKSVSANNAIPGIRNLYYATKQAAHIISKTLCAKNNLSYIETIISNIYGPGAEPLGFINSTLIKFLMKEEAQFTAGEQLYDFIYISDAVKELALVAEKGRPFNAYYVGSLNPRKLKEFIYDIRDCVDSSIELGMGKIKTAIIDINYNDFDMFRIRDELGFIPSVDFNEGIQNTKLYLLNEMKREWQ